MIIDVMQHNADKDLGAIAAWADAADIRLRVHELHEGDDIRALNPADMDGVLLLDGDTSVNADETWLAAERIIIRSLDKLGRPVFGIGMGARQIVRAFGAPIFPVTPVAGMITVTELSSGAEFAAAADYAEEMAELPGATQLYTSAVTANMGFKYHAHILGVQFNLENGADTEGQARLQTLLDGVFR